MLDKFSERNLILFESSENVFPSLFNSPKNSTKRNKNEQTDYKKENEIKIKISAFSSLQKKNTKIYFYINREKKIAKTNFLLHLLATAFEMPKR